MSKDKKAKSKAAVSYEVSAVAPGVNTYSGEILELSSLGVQIRYKKPRSKNFLISFFPMSTVVTITGVAGEDGSVSVKSPESDVDFMEGSIVDSDIPGMVKIKGERTYYVAEQHIQANVLEKV